MWLQYNEAAARKLGKEGMYENWFRAFGLDKAGPVKLIREESHGFITVTAPKKLRATSEFSADTVSVHKDVYLPVALNKDLGDYL